MFLVRMHQSCEIHIEVDSRTHQTVLCSCAQTFQIYICLNRYKLLDEVGRGNRRRLLKTKAHKLHSIIWLTGRQWSSSFIVVVIWSNFRFPTVSLAQRSILTVVTVDEQRLRRRDSQYAMYCLKRTMAIKTVTWKPFMFRVHYRWRLLELCRQWNVYTVKVDETTTYLGKLL